MISSAACWPCSRRRGRRKILLHGCSTAGQNLFATNDISGEFLQSALRGEYSEPAIHLLQAADRGIGEITGYAKSFLHIGHSSGIDTLCGMLWVLDNFAR